jgi:hypothetical protein
MSSKYTEVDQDETGSVDQIYSNTWRKSRSRVLLTSIFKISAGSLILMLAMFGVLGIFGFQKGGGLGFLQADTFFPESMYAYVLEDE